MTVTAMFLLLKTKGVFFSQTDEIKRDKTPLIPFMFSELKKLIIEEYVSFCLSFNSGFWGFGIERELDINEPLIHFSPTFCILTQFLLDLWNLIRKISQFCYFFCSNWYYLDSYASLFIDMSYFSAFVSSIFY